MVDWDQPFERIARRIFADGRLVRHWPLEGGVSAEVEALEIRGPDDAMHRVVSRRHRNAEWKAQSHSVTRREHDLLATLHRLGLPVPRPMLLDESASVLPSPYFVMEFVDGTTTIEPEWLGAALAEMAEVLVQIHSLDLESAGLPDLPPREDPLDSLADSLPEDGFGASIRSALSIEADASREDGGPPGLLHGDYWPGNLLWRDGRLAAVLDWEDAAIGDPLSDLACARVELLCTYGAAAMETFTEHYCARASISRKRLLLWEIYVSAAALKTMASWGLEPEVEAARRQTTADFMERAGRAWLGESG